VQDRVGLRLGGKRGYLRSRTDIDILRRTASSLVASAAVSTISAASMAASCCSRSRCSASAEENSAGTQNRYRPARQGGASPNAAKALRGKGECSRASSPDAAIAASRSAPPSSAPAGAQCRRARSSGASGWNRNTGQRERTVGRSRPIWCASRKKVPAGGSSRLLSRRVYRAFLEIVGRMSSPLRAARLGSAASQAAAASRST